MKTHLCLWSRGKSVLCEKPLGVNEAQVRAMIEKAKQKEVFLYGRNVDKVFPCDKKKRWSG